MTISSQVRKQLGEVTNKGTFEFVVQVETRDGYSAMKRFLEYFQSTVNGGSSTEVIVKSGGGEESFGFDGDGPVRIELMSSKQVSND